MSTIPRRIAARVARAPRLVVGPVSPGFGQRWLIDWANSVGRPVVHHVGTELEGPALLIPERRKDLESIPVQVKIEEMLVLDESSMLHDEVSWREALSLPHPSRDEWFEESGGWPAALDLRLNIGESELPLYRHPLAAVAFERILPQGTLREALVQCARAPLLLPELLAPLSLSGETVDELADAGHLHPMFDGWALPRPLRRYLVERVAPELAKTVATVLLERHHLDAALSSLSDAGLWGDYLELLALNLEPHPSIEPKLRRSLARVPQRLHEEPSYLHLLGALERLRGELSRAERLYRTARTRASGDLRSRIENARGVVLALDGRLESARRSFGAAIRHASSSRLEGEARHNRAGVFVRQGRYENAELDLREAVAHFRAGAEFGREARSLQLLALGWHRRGLLDAAQRSYEEAVDLLSTLGQPTALLRTNLAEVHLLRGSPEKAREQLDQAANESALDERALGYVEVNRAMVEHGSGESEVALQRLSAILRQESLDAHLRQEAELLTARILRRLGRGEEALEHVRAAAAGPDGEAVAVRLELALCTGGGLGEVIEQARSEEARFELTSALLERGKDDDLTEALELIRHHGFGLLLETPDYAQRLASWALKDDSRAADLFPLRITAFGRFEVRFLGRTFSLADFPTRKSAALLVRLAQAGHPLGRESVADEFWFEAGNPSQNLQTALYHLGKTLGVPVVKGRRGSLELATPFELDLKSFEQRASAFLAGTSSQGVEPLQEILGIARGEPLADFPEWFDEDRRHLEGLALKLWRRLAELDVVSPERTTMALERVLALDPYDLSSREHLIRLYGELGQDTQARGHEDRRLLLERELLQ